MDQQDVDDDTSGRGEYRYLQAGNPEARVVQDRRVQVARDAQPEERIDGLEPVVHERPPGCEVLRVLARRSRRPKARAQAYRVKAPPWGRSAWRVTSPLLAAGSSRRPTRGVRAEADRQPS